MTVLRPFVMLAILVGACFLANRHVEHHHVEMVATEDGGQEIANPSSVFPTFFQHVIPAPVVAAHGDDDHEEHAGDDHGAEAHAEPLIAMDANFLPAIFDGDPHHDGTQFVFYNMQIFQLAALLMILVAFSGVPGYLRTGKGDWVTKHMAGFCLWLRDDLVEPAMGKDLATKLLPMMMFLFFFIMFMNVMGLTPMSVTPTGSIYVTAAFASITLFMIIAGGIIASGPIGFFKNQVPHVPGFIWPLMFFIEVLGNLVLKPAALMIRLFATMTGGHLVVLSFLALVFFFSATYGTLGVALSPVWVGFGVFIMIIEAFVALIQAYIFTLLSSLFIGAAVHPEH